MTDQTATDSTLVAPRKKRRPLADPVIDRLPPHSHEAEQGVLGCVIQSPNGLITKSEMKLGKTGDAFYDLRHQTIWETIVTMHDAGRPIDTITLNQDLKNRQLLEQVGGFAYLNSLPDTVSSTENLDGYLDIVAQKFTLRKIIRTCSDTIGRVYSDEGDMHAIVSETTRSILGLLDPVARSTTQEHWRITDLISYDITRDPNAIVGWREPVTPGGVGITTRYLCRGYAAWLIGQSGIGKSTLGQQQAYMWALNRPFFGMRPVRALRVLIVQNENDRGDCAEATQGILDSGAFTPEEFDLLNERVKIIRCRGKTGLDFCRWLEREVKAWRADIVYVDPLLRYAGIDVSRQDQCTNFLNNCLDPVLAETGVVLIGAHHTGKPKAARETQGWTIFDHMYAGIGSSELVNWARAVSVIRVLPDGLFELMLAKRGGRAWATHPLKEGQTSADLYPTTSVFLKHAADRIFWEQVQPPEIPDRPERKASAAGRPNKITEVATSNLHEFCTGCLPDGEGLNAIAKRLESTLAKNRMDVSLPTCKRVIPALVANGKLLKNSEGLYLKGPEA